MGPTFGKESRIQRGGVLRSQSLEVRVRDEDVLQVRTSAKLGLGRTEARTSSVSLLADSFDRGFEKLAANFNHVHIVVGQRWVPHNDKVFLGVGLELEHWLNGIVSFGVALNGVAS